MASMMQRNQAHIATTIEWGHGFVIDRAHDTRLIGVDGHEYIDFMSGWNVANVGWSRPEIKYAIVNQLEKTAYCPPWCTSEPAIHLAEKLAELTPAPLEVCFRATSGSEANEIALLLARAYTKRQKIISFSQEYHGSTLGSLSLGNSPDETAAFEPLLPGFIKLPIPTCFYESSAGANQSDLDCLKEIRAYLKQEDIAAVFLEAIMTGPGVYKPRADFFPELRRLCDEVGTLLIIDEVGTGFGRTGKMFAIEHFDFIPDIMTFAKALGGGYVPIGGTITRSEIAESLRGKLVSSTFGWTPLACAAALANLKILEQEHLCKRSSDFGTYLKDQLRLLLKDQAIVGEIRGVGMELAIDIVNIKGGPWLEKAIQIVALCEENGLVVELSPAACAVLLMPPLIIEREELNNGVDILRKVIQSSAKE